MPYSPEETERYQASIRRRKRAGLALACIFVLASLLLLFLEPVPHPGRWWAALLLGAWLSWIFLIWRCPACRTRMGKERTCPHCGLEIEPDLTAMLTLSVSAQATVEKQSDASPHGRESAEPTGAGLPFLLSSRQEGLSGKPLTLDLSGPSTEGSASSETGGPKAAVVTAEEEATFGFQQKLRAITPRAWATPALLAINVLVFVVMILSGVSPMDPDSETLLKWGADSGPLTTSGEGWRVLTSMFLHFGIVHLAFNMWALYATGSTIERLFGSAPFLLIYLLSGVAGNFVSLIFNPHVVSAGASGAIFGILGSLAAFLVARRSTIHWSVSSRLWRNSLPTIVYSLLNGFGDSRVDNAAHIGGLLGGFLLGLILSRPLEPQPASKRLGRLAAAALAAALVLPLLWRSVPKEWAEYLANLQLYEDDRSQIEVPCEELVRQGRSGEIDDRAFADAFDMTCLPRMREAAARLSRTPQWIKDDKKEFFQGLDLEVRMWETYVIGVKEGDEEKIREAGGMKELFDQLVQKANSSNGSD